MILVLLFGDVAVPDCIPLSAFLSCRPQQARFGNLIPQDGRTGLYIKFKKNVLNKMCIYKIFDK